MNTALKTALSVVGVALILIAGYLYLQSKSGIPSEQVMCAADVQECADGSFVTRVAPTCEFAQCTVTSSATTTKNYVDEKLGIAFEYLDNFYINSNLTQYIHPVDWPPQISVSTSTYACKTTGATVGADGKTETKTINGRLYCLTTQSEGAAGSVYTTYTYKIPVQKKTISMSFVVRAPQCGNYDDPNKSACEKEKLDFNVDNMIDKIFNTIKFTTPTTSTTTAQ